MKSNKIKMFLLSLSVFSLGTLVSCEDESATEFAVDSNFVSLVDAPQGIEVPVGETISYSGKVYAAEAKGFDRTIQLRVVTTTNDPGNVEITDMDAADYSVPASVTIPAGSKEGVFQVSITDNNLGYEGKRLVIELVPQEGIDMTMSSGGSNAVTPSTYEVFSDRLALNARRLCDQNKLSIQIFTDAYGTETTWELYDSNGNIVTTGGPYADAAGSGETRLTCLPDGAYTFIAYDLYGDGMNDGNNEGYYRLVRFDADGNEIEIAKNGTFASYDIVEFTLP